MTNWFSAYMIDSEWCHYWILNFQVELRLRASTNTFRYTHTAGVIIWHRWNHIHFRDYSSGSRWRRCSGWRRWRGLIDSNRWVTWSWWPIIKIYIVVVIATEAAGAIIRWRRWSGWSRWSWYFDSNWWVIWSWSLDIIQIYFVVVFPDVDINFDFGHWNMLLFFRYTTFGKEKGDVISFNLIGSKISRESRLSVDVENSSWIEIIKIYSILLNHNFHSPLRARFWVNGNQICIGNYSITSSVGNVSSCKILPLVNMSIAAKSNAILLGCGMMKLSIFVHLNAKWMLVGVWFHYFIFLHSFWCLVWKLYIRELF